MKYNVFDYLNISSREKLEFFMETRSEISHVPSYWFDFDNVRKNMDKFGPDLFTLDWLIGKNHEELVKFFSERPHLITLVPQLLGIRDSKFEKSSDKKSKILKIQGPDGEYKLDFGVIDLNNFDKYINFVVESGLEWVLCNGLRKSIHDYALGVEAGMDSNGRKNRSGQAGEAFLESVLKMIANKNGWIAKGQTTIKNIKKWYGIDLDSSFINRRYDGSLYNPSRQKLYLFEVNNFNSNGSKSKSSATEFKDLHDRFSRTNHEFIYITDGKGWDSDQSHLIEAMEYIGKVFNYKMVESGYLEDYLE